MKHQIIDEVNEFASAVSPKMVDLEHFQNVTRPPRSYYLRKYAKMVKTSLPKSTDVIYALHAESKELTLGQ